MISSRGAGETAADDFKANAAARTKAVEKKRRVFMTFGIWGGRFARQAKLSKDPAKCESFWASPGGNKRHHRGSRNMNALSEREPPLFDWLSERGAGVLLHPTS